MRSVRPHRFAASAAHVLAALAVFAVGGTATAQSAGRDTTLRAEELEEKMTRLRREMEALRAQQRELQLREAQGREGAGRDGPPRVNGRMMVRTDGPTMTICEYRERRPEGWLGISFAPPQRVNIQRGRGPVLTFTGPIAVDEVLPASPAARAGIAVGDSIVTFNGESVAGREIAFETLLRPGSTLAVQARRAGKVRDFKVEITPRPEDDREPCREVPAPMPFLRGAPNPLVDLVFEMDSADATLRDRVRELRVTRGTARTPRGTTVIVPGVPDIPEPPRPPGFTFSTSREVVILFGAQLGVLTDELQELTGTKKGVFVSAVSEGSPAAASGLRTADVLQKVGDSEVLAPRDVRRLIAPGDRSAQFTVVRKKKPVVLTVNW
ncbi:MAG: PDZ domain-containing protein [Gemmatimonadaceae bacterium]|nr:PDZ domain-containing protein [Gemmatimonadaceae bacterium]